MRGLCVPASKLGADSAHVWLPRSLCALIAVSPPCAAGIYLFSLVLSNLEPVRHPSHGRLFPSPPVIPWLRLCSPQDSALLVVSYPTLCEGACRRSYRAAVCSLLVRRSEAVCRFLQCERKQKPAFIVNAEHEWASRCRNKHVPSRKPFPSGGSGKMHKGSY